MIDEKSIFLDNFLSISCCNLILRRKVSVRKKALFCSARKRPVNSRKASSKGTQLGKEQRNNTIKCFAIERKEGKKK